MHDPRVGRFFKVDPLASKYPHNSPYAFSENRVIDAIELEGLEAWPIKNRWDENYISKYRSFIEVETAKMVEEENRFTCEDFALHLLIEFASNNNLPVTVINGTGTLNAGSEEFPSKRIFRLLAFNSTGANDLKNTTNLIGEGNEGFKKGQKGDIILLDYDGANNDGDANHTQVITGTTMGINKRIWISQGNTVGGSSNYNSLLYGGAWIQDGVWDLEDNSYYNFYREIETPNATYELNPKVYEWNFNLFNFMQTPYIDSKIETPKNEMNQSGRENINRT